MIRVVAGILMREDKILICQRTRHQSKPLKWEFPGGKIEAGEQPRDALRRELEEELGIQADVGDEVERLIHTYEDGNMVELRFFAVGSFAGQLENRIFRDIQWVPREKLTEYDFLEADLPLVRELAAGKVI
ncbi:MAG TPA: (deoxy)nucleoside triphosphate pyrophosphohydrolase [Terriglobales bacterium]|nr:(deoxy)nucleoside triphosphate pyrophosphohydrolase [Terriglobales bacterium]